MMRKLLLFTLAASITLPSLAGGGWISKKGNGYFKLEQRWIRADQFFDREGAIVPITTTSIYLTNLYGEYGITDRIDIVGTVPLVARGVLNERQFTRSGRVEPGDTVTSLGDMLIGAKYGIIQDKAVVLAAGLYFGIPTGNPAGGNTMLLQTGDGEFNQLFKLESGISLYPMPAYINLGVGFNNRTKGFSEEFHYNAELGYTIKDKVLVSARVWSVSSFFNGDAPNAVNGIFSNNTEYFSYGPQLAYLHKGGKMGASFAVDYAASGKNVLARPAWGIGIFYKP